MKTYTPANYGPLLSAFLYCLAPSYAGTVICQWYF